MWKRVKQHFLYVLRVARSSCAPRTVLQFTTMLSAEDPMLESSASMSMSGLTHPRPRNSETEGLSSLPSSPIHSDIMEDFSEHGHTGSSWSLHLQRLLHQANQRKVSVALALLMFTMVMLSLPGAPHMASQVPGQLYNMANSSQSSATSSAAPLSADKVSKLQQSTDPLGETGLPESSSTAEQAILEAIAANRSSNATRAPVCPSLVVPDSYWPAGEPPRTGRPISHFVRSPRSLEKPQEERVLILAANSGGSCALQLGDYYTFLSLLDKLQYGNVHGYDVLLGLGNVDDDLRKTWNKVAWMQKALNETAREDAEWILWMDLDTVAVQSDIAFPLEDYEGKDVVLWIQPDLVLHGDAFQLNTGVMLLRNTDWTRGFIDDVARLGKMHVNHWQLMDQVFQEELTTHFDSGLFDQNAMAYLMKRYQASVMPHIFAADRVFRINAFWRDYLHFDFTRLDEFKDSVLFNHFSGCSMCAGKDNNEDLQLCEAEFQRTFELANCTYTQMNQTSSPSYVKEVHAMLGQLPFCRAKPTPPQCLQYMDIDQYDQTRMPQPLRHRRMLSQEKLAFHDQSEDVAEASKLPLH